MKANEKWQAHFEMVEFTLEFFEFFPSLKLKKPITMSARSK